MICGEDNCLPASVLTEMLRCRVHERVKMEQKMEQTLLIESGFLTGNVRVSLHDRHFFELKGTIIRELNFSCSWSRLKERDLE